MKISTKLAVIGFSSVLISIGVSILIASCLIHRQNDRQNKARLAAAYQSIEKMLLKSIDELAANYQTTVKEGPWGYFGALVDSPQPPSSLLKLDSGLFRLLINLGEFNQTDFTFYSSFGDSAGDMIVHYSQTSPGRLRVKDGILAASAFKIELKAATLPFDPEPRPDEVPPGVSLQGFDQAAYIVYKVPYLYQGWERASGLGPGTQTGFFIFKKKVPIDLGAQSISLGTQINLYATNGRMLAGTVDLRDLKMNRKHSPLPDVLYDTGGQAYDALARPLVFAEKTVGFLSMSISHLATRQKILQSVLLLLASGILILIVIGCITFFTVRQIIRPLSKLVHVNRSISMDNLEDFANLDIGVKGQDNELKILEQAFNTMVQNLSASQKALQHAKEAAETASRAKSDFLMNMSHELRTPLNGIMTAAEMMLTCDSPKEREDVHKIITSSSQALLHTVETILNFTKTKEGTLQIVKKKFQLDTLMGKLKTRFFHKGGFIDLQLELDIKSECIPNALVGDADRLIEILDHLLENAAKFAATTPKAVVGIQLVERAADTVQLEFSVSDNGIGIATENLDKIFEPFSQADMSSTRQYDGVGIGLSVCKQLVELMGGEIWVESQLGLGSTFHFRLPFETLMDRGFFSLHAHEAPSENDSGKSAPAKCLPHADIERLAPVVLNLQNALANFDPQGIQAHISEITQYDLPQIDELARKIEEYEYEEAAAILKTIAAVTGVKLEP